MIVANWRVAWTDAPRKTVRTDGKVSYWPNKRTYRVESLDGLVVLGPYEKRKDAENSMCKRIFEDNLPKEGLMWGD